ncbi:MAG: hypothetical protein ABW162_18285 [Candidatus Sedimenticola sp. PURPLELP]
MSLKVAYNPFEAFVKRGDAYVEKPGVVNGIEFDDATVALKRHVISQLHDEELALKLNRLGELIRKQHNEEIPALFEEIRGSYSG